MKYLIWFLISLWMLIRKIIGLVLIYPAYPFRGYARSIVYNYVLQNDIYLKRLQERKPMLKHDRIKVGWVLHSKYHTKSMNGYIAFRKVSYIQYLLVLWFIWGWLDDDSNQDTFDAGYNLTLIRRERLKWLPDFIKVKLLQTNDECPVYGNSFDLGDLRKEYSCYGFWSALLWNNRNTAYNFHYLFHTTVNEKLVWHKEFLGGNMGWLKENNSPTDKQSYKLVIWEKIQ